jgi:hypothetical protein
LAANTTGDEAGRQAARRHDRLSPQDILNAWICQQSSVDIQQI